VTKTNETPKASESGTADAAAVELKARIAELEAERGGLLNQVASAEKKAELAKSASEAELEAAKAELALLRERVGESSMAQQALVLDLERVKGKKVRILIPYGEGETGKHPVRIGVNGTYHCLIPRGIEAVVPSFVLPVLNDAVEDSYSMGTDSLGRSRGLSDATPRPRFPYQFLGVLEE